MTIRQPKDIHLSLFKKRILENKHGVKQEEYTQKVNPGWDI